MCQAQIVLQSAESEEAFLEDVIRMQVDGETIWLSRFFEDPVAVRATVMEIDFLKHTVILAPTAEDKGGDE
jgi:predicted RNA-binding protein